MKKYLLIAVLALILSAAGIKGEYDITSNIVPGMHNSTSARVTTLATLEVLPTYDSLLAFSNGISTVVNAAIVYRINDLSGIAFNDSVAFVDVNCTSTDYSFDLNGNVILTTVTQDISQRYTTLNTPTSIETQFYQVGKNGKEQCLFTTTFKNSSIILNAPYTYNFVTPTYGDNFVSRISDYLTQKANALTIAQSEHQTSVLQAYNDSIAGYVAFIVKGVYELYLVLFFLVKIALIYVAFILVILAIVFPVFLLIRFRKKVKEWLNMEKTY